MDVLKIRSSLGGDVTLSNEVPSNFTYEKINHDHLYFARGDFGHFVIQGIQGIGVSAWDNQYNFKVGTVIEGGINMTTYEFYSSVVNHFKCDLEGIGAHSHKTKEGGILYSDHIHSKSYYHGGVPCRSVDFHFERWVLEQYVEDYPKLYDFVNRSVQNFSNASMPNFSVTEDIARIHNEIRFPIAGRYGKERYVAFKCEEILIRIMNQLHAGAPSVTNIITPSNLDKAEHVAFMLREQLDQEHSLVTLSKIVGMNKSYLQRAFKQKFGLPIFSYLNELRLQHSKKLLADTSMRIADIAIASGLGNNSAFTHAFTKRFGVSPTEYRKTKMTLR